MKTIKYQVRVTWVGGDGKEVEVVSHPTSDKELQENIKAICQAQKLTYS